MSAGIKVSHGAYFDPPILEGEIVIAVLVGKPDGKGLVRVKSLVIEKATPADRDALASLLRTAAAVIESGHIPT